MAPGTDVAVSGTVTVQPGRILGERTLVLQDGTGGIPVRLPAGIGLEDFARGTLVQVSGELADPYGNQELRPRAPADVAVLGSGGLPQPASITTAGLAERREGVLAVLEVSVAGVDHYDSGAVSIKVRDDAGDGRVYAFGPIGLPRDAVSSGDRVRAVGIVGQRESTSGAGDGYRLWLRGPGDLQVQTPPEPTPTATDGRGDDGEEADQVPRVAIADAREGMVVTVAGVITTKAGFIDPEARRVVIQDGSGAILVRYPTDAQPASVGRKIKVTGEVGTWFEARQIAASTTPKRVGRGKVRPARLQRPPGEADEWSLVVADVQVTDVERSGDTWRAEVALEGGETLPVVGIAGAGIPGDLLEPGRAARVIGIVRRAHPSASDQRFAIAPRSIKDIRLGELAVAGGMVVEPIDEGGAAGAPTSVSAAGGLVSVALGSLGAHESRTVQVGGRVSAAGARQFVLDDGTGSGVVRLAAASEPIEPPLEVDEVVNAVGHVRARKDGRPEVLVSTTADIRRAASLIPRGSEATGRTAAPGLPLPAAADTGPSASAASARSTAERGPDLLLSSVSVTGLAASLTLLLAAAAVAGRRRTTG